LSPTVSFCSLPLHSLWLSLPVPLGLPLIYIAVFTTAYASLPSHYPCARSCASFLLLVLSPPRCAPCHTPLEMSLSGVSGLVVKISISELWRPAPRAPSTSRASPLSGVSSFTMRIGLVHSVYSSFIPKSAVPDRFNWLKTFVFSLHLEDNSALFNEI